VWTTFQTCYVEPATGIQEELTWLALSFTAFDDAMRDGPAAHIMA